MIFPNECCATPEACSCGYNDWDEPEEEDCFHEEYDTDWEGRATCSQCGESWWLTSTQIRAQHEAQEAFDAYASREMRKERIAAWVRPLAFWRRWRKPRSKDLDDEIPF